MSPKHEARLPLAFIPAGSEVRLVALGDEIDPLQREQLTAYGLAENRPLKVLQQRPMTVILAEEVELALEGEGLAIANLLKDAGLVETTSEALRMIKQGAVKVDGDKLEDGKALIGAGTAVYQVGKRKFARVTVK